MCIRTPLIWLMLDPVETQSAGLTARFKFTLVLRLGTCPSWQKMHLALIDSCSFAMFGAYLPSRTPSSLSISYGTSHLWMQCFVMPELWFCLDQPQNPDAFPGKERVALMSDMYLATATTLLSHTLTWTLAACFLSILFGVAVTYHRYLRTLP